MPEYSELARLYDTFGLRPDLIEYVLFTRGLAFEEERFWEALRELQQSQNDAFKSVSKQARPAHAALAEEGSRPSFVDMSKPQSGDCRVVALIRGDERVDELAPASRARSCSIGRRSTQRPAARSATRAGSKATRRT